MVKTITQAILFRNTTTAILYELYMNAKKHSIVTQASAKISAKEGAPFTAYGNYITGKNLQLIKNRLIVQKWRGSDWDKNDIDSTFILYFEQKRKDVVLNVTHSNLPKSHAAGIDKGWHDFYWKPWKQWLAERKITKAVM